MNLILLLSGLIVAQAAGIRGSCDIVSINGQLRTRETLVSGHDVVYINVDPNSKDVYFALYKKNSPKLAKVDLTSKEITIMANFSSYRTLYAIDHDEKAIYMRGKYLNQSGILTFDQKHNKSTFMHINGMLYHNINKLYFKKSLYFKCGHFSTDWYVIKDGTYHLVEDLEDTNADSNFVIDDNSMSYYYGNISGLYRQKIGTKDAVLIHKINEPLRDLIIDSTGRVYAGMNDGIYILNNTTLRLEKLFTITQTKLHPTFGFAIDTDGNFIYIDWSGLYRYVANTSITADQYCEDLDIINPVDGEDNRINLQNPNLCMSIDYFNTNCYLDK